MIINIKNRDENKKIVEEIKNRISDLKDRIKNMSEKEKKNADETLKIMRKVLDYNKKAQNNFHRASKVDKGKSKLKFEENLTEKVKVKNQKDNLSEKPEQKKFNNFSEQIKKDQKNIDINWFKNVFNYETLDKMLKYLHSLETTNDYNQAASLIEESFADFGDEVKLFQKVIKK